MASFKRFSMILMASTACAAVAGCSGADGVASPGAGSVTIVTPAPTPTPTPTATATPAAITAAQFAEATTITAGGNMITVTADEQLAIVNAGANNNVNGTGSMINGLAPVSATSLTTATNASTINNFFAATNFVGALSGPTDTAFQNWTCNSSAATFGGTSVPCSNVPAIGTGGSTAVCPTGTTAAAALLQTFRVCELPQAITTSLTLPRIQGVVYRFTGETTVGTDVGTTGADSGVTLTIAPGVTLIANSSEATTDVLIVNRGSRISAIGTVNEPIIFTSQQNLTVGNVGDATQGQWGGVVLLGRAPVGVCLGGITNDAGGTSTTCQNRLEGTNVVRNYGGPNAADNSGTLSFVQIRFTGVALADGNELQGLTMGGTGSGTTIDHVQSHNSADDGVEIFGGTTNLRYFVVTGADDDGFDIDFGYRGFMQFIIAAQKASGATADSFSTEIDSTGGNEDALPRTFSTYANFTFIQTANAPAAIRHRGGADMRYVNGVVRTPLGVKCVNIIAGETSPTDRSTVRAAGTGPTINGGPQEFGPPSFNSVYFACQGR